MVLPVEEGIDAKLEEIDRLIGELQNRRQELLEAKEAARAEKAYEEGSLEAKVTVRAEKPIPKSPRPSEPVKSTTGFEGTLNSLPWKSFKKKEGEWTFLRDREGRLVDELQSAKEFVEEVRKKNEVIVGNYKYRISEDKFLNRYLA
jgi:hypothetical protein